MEIVETRTIGNDEIHVGMKVMKNGKLATVYAFMNGKVFYSFDNGLVPTTYLLEYPFRHHFCKVNIA